MSNILENNWIKWDDGKCPVPLGTPVEVQHRDGERYEALAGTGYADNWYKDNFDSDIVAYRIINAREETQDMTNKSNIQDLEKQAAEMQAKLDEMNKTIQQMKEGPKAL